MLQYYFIYAEPDGERGSSDSGGRRPSFIELDFVPEAKTSNVFVSNRLKEIWMFVEQMKDYGFKFRLSYVPTCKSNADLLTRSFPSKDLLGSWSCLADPGTQ